MKKIGILTIQKVDNYGAELQAFALYKMLSVKGYNVELIDYLYVKHPQHKEEAVSKPFVSFKFRDKIKWKIFRVAQKLIPYYRSSLFRRRKERFDEFYSQIKYSLTFDRMSKLYSSKLDYDVFIVGSDQVWNPTTMTNLDPYFLKFVSSNAIKISYASSFGVTSIPDYLHQLYNSGLNNFDVISSREKEGVELINDIAKRKAEHVLDPTLLLTKDDWASIAKPYDFQGFDFKGHPYILIYTLEKSDYVIELAKWIKEKTNWRIIKINTRHIGGIDDNVDVNVFDSGPAEFVSLFLNAAFVLTNSFHGTAFSINFEIPFYTTFSNQKKNNSRQIGLLSKSGLSERLILEGTDFENLPDISCSFGNSTQNLVTERERSIEYLLNAVNLNKNVGTTV